MKAIFKHELHSFYTGLFGYVFGAFLLLFAGIYIMVINLSSGYVNFEYVPSNMSFVYIIIIPILTMRIFAEEKRQKTDQLLYSLPLSMTRIVFGKYLAMVVVLLIPIGIMSIYPIVLSRYGAIHLPLSLGAVFALFLLGAALIAIGMFLSSVTANQATAAGLCFVVMLLNYFLVSLAGYVSGTAVSSFVALTVLIGILVLIVYWMIRNLIVSLIVGLVLEAALTVWYVKSPSSFEGLFGAFIARLSLYERFSRFINGVFDITSVVYFLSVIAIFLFLTVQALEKRRWSE